MTKQGIFTILENTKLTENVYKMILSGDTSAVTIIYKVVGKGTAYMANLTAGKELDVLSGLGNGFDTCASGENPVVIGGGVGVPPMFGLAKELIKQGKKVTAILGFNTKDEIFYEDEFKAIGCETVVTTVDGSYGTKGFVTDALKEIACTYTYACGPEPMLKAIYNTSTTRGQYSFEERMGCGFGACMGCSCKTKYGNKRICKDGPVLVKEEIIW